MNQVKQQEGLAMICPQCGKENGDQARFCHACGIGLQITASDSNISGTVIPTKNEPSVKEAEDSCLPKSSNNQSNDPVDIPLTIHGIPRVLTNVFLVLFSVSFLAALLGITYYMIDIARGDPVRTDLFRSLVPFIFMIVIFLIFIVSLALFNIMERKLAEKETVLPLLHSVKKGFFICEEGIYIRKRKNILRNNLYCLYPWISLSLYAMNENKRIITLKAGRTLLKLRSHISYKTKEDCFEDMQQVIIDHLPEKGRDWPEKQVRFNWVVAWVLLIALVIVDVSMSDYLESISKGKIGDGLCDINNHAKPRFQTTIYYGFLDNLKFTRSHETVTHEYCGLHGLAYAAIHPFTTIQSTYLTISQKNTAEESGDLLIVASIISLLFWCMLISIATSITMYKWRKWHKTPTLYQ